MNIVPSGKFARLLDALEEIGKPIHPSWPTERIALHVRYVAGPIATGLRAEDFADVALHRIAQ